MKKSNLGILSTLGTLMIVNTTLVTNLCGGYDFKWSDLNKSTQAQYSKLSDNCKFLADSTPKQTAEEIIWKCNDSNLVKYIGVKHKIFYGINGTVISEADKEDNSNASTFKSRCDKSEIEYFVNMSYKDSNETIQGTIKAKKDIVIFPKAPSLFNESTHFKSCEWNDKDEVEYYFVSSYGRFYPILLKPNEITNIKLNKDVMSNK